MKLTAGWKWVLIASVLVLAACYSMPYVGTMVLPESGAGKVAVATVDERPYVLNGKNPPDYVGIIRGGFGNPFNRSTDDEKPLADDFSLSIVRSLMARGYQAVAIHTPPANNSAAALKSLEESSAPRLVLVEIRDWQSDTMVNPTVNYDVTLHVYTGTGREITSVTDTKNQDLSGGNFFNTAGSSSDLVYHFYEHKLIEWFSNPKVEAALQN